MCLNQSIGVIEITDNLKPCPFCGSAVEITEVVSDYGIRCPECGLILIEDDTGTLVSKWNQRAVNAVSIPAVRPAGGERMISHCDAEFIAGGWNDRDWAMEIDGGLAAILLLMKELDEEMRSGCCLRPKLKQAASLVAEMRDMIASDANKGAGE